MLAIVQFSAAREAGLGDLARGLPLLLETHLAGAELPARSVLLRVRESAAGSGLVEIESPASSELLVHATRSLSPDYVLSAHLSTAAGDAQLALEATVFALPGPTNVYSRRFEGRRADLPSHVSALALDVRELLKSRPDPLGPDPGDVGTSSYEAMAAFCRALLAPPDSTERIAALEEAIAADPGYPDAALSLAREHLRARRAQDAKALLARADSEGRVDPRVLRLRGLLHETLGDPAGALAAYQRLKAARPESAAADFHVGCALVALRRFAEAETALARYVAAHPDKVEGHENLGVARLRRGDLAGAIESFRAGLAARPDSPGLHAKLGSALAEKGDVSGARAAFEEGLRAGAPHAPLLFNYALHLAPTDPGRAIELYERAVELDPTDLASLTNLGALRVRRLEYEAAEAAWRKVDATAPGTPAGKLARENLERLADPAFRESLEATVLGAIFTETRAVGLAPAIRKMTEMTEKRPDSWYAWLLLGMALRENHDQPEALAAYAKVLELNPEQPDALTETSVIQGQLGRLEASLETSRRAVAAAPDSAAIVCNLGVAFLRLSRFDEAEAEFERARALAPDDPVIENCFEALELGRAGKDVRFL